MNHAQPLHGADPAQELGLLIKSRYPIVFLETWEEERAERLVRTIARRLNKPLFVWTATKGLFRSDLPNAIYNTAQPLQALAHISSMSLVALYLLKDFQAHLEDPIILRKLKDISEQFESREGCLIICSSVVSIPTDLKRIAVHFVLQLPSREELRRTITETVDEMRYKGNVHIGLTADEMDQLADRLKGLTGSEARRAICQAILDDNRLTQEDLPRILERKKEIIEKSSILEVYYCEDPSTSIGGMKQLKAWLAKRKKVFSREAEKQGLQPPKGILILGVQGCGKSQMAKTVAMDWGLPLLRLDPGKIYDKYIGESEKNLRQALTIAESMAPVVLWIDEIEKGFSYSQGSDADAGLSKRVFGAFLTWLQEKEGSVFVVATANDIPSLPPEFLRKGRFDEIFFVDLPGLEERKEIFAIHLRKRKKDPQEFDLGLLAERAKGFSGAEIEQVIISGLYSAFSGSGNLNTKLILEEIESTKPLSVTMREKIDDLRDWARERTVPAGESFNEDE
jgi:SpoVK/Ycf46/Vps4 family AAA+-type ATPase